MPSWELQGNRDTFPATDFLGTTDSVPLSIRTNDIERVHIGLDGSLTAGLMVLNARDDTNEGGEITLLGAGFNPRVHIDNFMGAFRVFNDRAELLRVSPDGNVGIGTTQPSAALEIKQGDLLLKAVSEDPGDIVFQNFAGEQKGRIWSNPGTGAGLFLSNGDNNPDISINAAGNVGIGTPAPQVLLHAVGRNRIRLQTAAGSRTLDLRSDGAALDIETNGPGSESNLFINGNGNKVIIRNLEGRNLEESSSCALKENIADFTVEEAIEALDGLKPIPSIGRTMKRKRCVLDSLPRIHRGLQPPPTKRRSSLHTS